MSAIDQYWARKHTKHQEEPDLSDPYESGDPPLLQHLLSGDISGATRLLEEGAAVHTLEATLLGDAAALSRLLQIGASAWHKTQLGWTALHLAAFYGRVDCLPVLLQAGLPADLRARAPRAYEGCTPLQLAVANQQEQTTRILLKAGANARLVDEAGWTPLHHAAHEGQRAIAKMLILAGADVNALCGDSTPLGLAKRQGQARVAALLLQVGGTD